MNMEPRQEVPFRAARAAGPQEMSWVHSAMANFYFYSRMPTLARRFRDQYHLRVSGSGRWSKASIERRKKPTARILYYHRVNDENDPFFPAISTSLFEAEVRFVSEHYRVVSLAELLNVLEGTSNEPVLAITFDDGYQDNYHNAFPILQRYGLPASIFLTTESMDTREPLWFERLAHCVKKTTRDCLDLEINGPRRFGMRTQAERLESIQSIFDILRGVPDSEMRDWLAHIIRELAVEDCCERRDKMLTWDQIRLMQRHRIDFGGHTVTHPFLSQVSDARAAWEVSECKRRIEEESQRPVAHFAYPHGRERDFDSRNKEVIRRAGFRAAVTTIWGPNFSSTDVMELRRGGPWENSPAGFAYKLDWYQLIDG
jgi:peptidoglycan/xylan/chitin deacetylase (PgdA/CDA1 family)